MVLKTPPEQSCTADPASPHSTDRTDTAKVSVGNQARTSFSFFENVFVVGFIICNDHIKSSLGS